mgnify:CR=1 FL=1
MIVTKLNIDKLQAADVSQTAVMLAESMSTNPNHLSIFGDPDPAAVEKQRKMFEMVLSDPKNSSFVVKLNDEVVGSMTYTSSACCQLPVLKLIRSMPAFLNMFGSSLPRVLKWRKNWADHDLSRPHVHFGPLAVRTSHQGRGIGKLLLSDFCRYLDETNQVGYLETDKPENVSFYQRFGFEVRETDTLFERTNWFMVRQPKHDGYDEF